MSSHAQALKSFARKLALLLMVRNAVRWATVWFFVWGVFVLAARISGLLKGEWLLFGLLGFVLPAALAAMLAWRQRPAFARVRATYDRLNQCGGLVMAEEAADMTPWQPHLPAQPAHGLQWRSGRSVGLLAVSVLFAFVALQLPDRLTALTAPPLEIGQLVGELRAEIETLQEEKIIEDTKAEDLQNQLNRLEQKSSGFDPNKTWEALDHIKESNNDLARQAAEEALSKITTLTQAETLGSALQAASEAGLGEDTATRAAQDLAGMLKAARLEEGLLKGEIPPELLSALDALSKEDMEKLLSAIQFNKSLLGKTITNLGNLKLIDAKLLGQCQGAGLCPNPDALAAFLCESTNCNSFCEAAISYCRGGVDRGRGDAPMTWKEASSEEGAQFKEDVLPPSTRLTDSQFVGVTRAAPDLSGDDVVAEHGALAGSQAGGGGAHSQVILPRHKQTVQRFFNREE